WSREGNVMVSLSMRQTEVDGKKATQSTFRLWDARTGKLKVNLGELNYPGLGTFGLSPDGKILAISYRPSIEAGDTVDLYEVEKGTLLKTIEVEYGLARPWFAFAPDNSTLAVCGFEFKDGKAVGTVRLMDTNRAALQQKLFSHGSHVISVVCSPDGKTLAAGCHEGEITIWSAATGEIRKKLKASGSIAAIAFSPDSMQLISGGSRGDVFIWDLADGKSHELKAPQA